MGQAVFKQKNGLVAVDVLAACGVLNPEQFMGLAEAARDTGVRAIKFTSRQTVVLVLEEKDVPVLADKIAGIGLRISPYGNTVRAVKACAGNSDLCPRAIADALNLGIEIQGSYSGQPVPKDFKIAVAGCPRGCIDPYCADFGLVADGKNTYSVVIGGRGGSAKPEHGTVIQEKIPASQVFPVLDHVLAGYRELAEPGERLCKTISRVGIDRFILPSVIKPGNEIDEEFGRFLTAGE
ncbi:MAG: nitrite reductase [Peptococcaceae bacterium]|nr:nitrite reductase [Peptococcaceae bacterium]